MIREDYVKSHCQSYSRTEFLCIRKKHLRKIPVFLLMFAFIYLKRYYFMLVHNPIKSFPGIIWNWPLYSEGRERPKKEAVHSRLAGGSFSKQKEFTHEASLGWQQDEWVLALTCKILKVYKEVLTEFSHIYPVGFPKTA